MPLLPSEVPLSQPSYDRGRLRPRLLHIGFGAFAKAHVMVFHDDMLRRTNSDWGVVAARLNSGSDELSLLDQADGLYAVGEMSGDDIAVQQVGAVIKTLHPRRDGTGALPAQIADPDLQMITLTITEKGYCLKDGVLDTGHPGIRHDLETPEAPVTAIGVMAEGLRRRWQAGLAPLTVLSCDNLPANGTLCRQAVDGFSSRLDPAFGEWVLTQCRFPCSMVDRITPAMTGDSHAHLTRALGRSDPNGVLCEPFRQWMIEDEFAADRPPWDQAGVEFVKNVAPFEDMKLRLLNGSHSFLAYLGALAGVGTIAGCMQQPLLMEAARRLMLEEQAPTLQMPDGVDIDRYAATLVERFSNTALHHKTTQIAADGSQKLPQRLLAPIRNHLAAGRPWPLSAMAVAGWMLYCRGKSEQGADLPLSDPLAARIAESVQTTDGAGYVDDLLSLHAVFGADLATAPEFRSTLQSAYQKLMSEGVLNSLQALLARVALN